ncbi:MAG TPA: EF-hand domain-containing protein [Kaistiaceae bacterium]|nr:EF-hand domain-containing protein [Kaistiaceae bacterium]
MMGGIGSLGGMMSQQSMRGSFQPPSFSSLDGDSSGGISLDELKASGPGGSQNAKDAARAEELFSKMDSDGDGSISESEKETFDKGVQDRMNAMQVMAQLAGGAGGAGGPPSAADMIANADTNEDGGISLDELKASTSEATSVDTEALEELFASIDEDSDGSISEDELSSFLDDLKEEGGPGGPGGEHAGPPPGPPPGGGEMGGTSSSDASSLAASLLSMAQSAYSSSSSLSSDDSLLSSLVEKVAA